VPLFGVDHYLIGSTALDVSGFGIYYTNHVLQILSSKNSSKAVWFWFKASQAGLLSHWRCGCSAFGRNNLCNLATSILTMAVLKFKKNCIYVILISVKKIMVEKLI